MFDWITSDGPPCI